MGVLTADLHCRALRAAPGRDTQVQAVRRAQMRHFAHAPRHGGTGGIHMRGRDGRQHLQASFRVAAQRPQYGRRFDAFQIPGSRHDHALYIFDDVAAAFRHERLRRTAQHLHGPGRPISDGDRL